jgi:Carboxypeptidase regulatory-like domain
MALSYLRRGIKALFFVTIVSLALNTAHAADFNARVRGTVTDPAGAVVPNARIVATNLATGVAFTTTSQADGGYFFAQLPIGTYKITITAQGFKVFSATGIKLSIDQEYVEPAKLDVGDVSEIVNVAADSVQVDTTDMELSNVVSGDQMQELPLIGRDFTQLMLTLPGVQMPDNRFGVSSVSGSQSQQSDYIINGADTNDIAINTIAFLPILDALGEFNLVDGPLNAEYDRNSGGIVSATIKEGSNHFHGDVYEFYRDTFLNTNSFLAKSATGSFIPVSPYHQNIFGGTLGGPILKDKLFFFGAYEGQRESVPETTTSSQVQVYSAAQLGGNFSTDLTGTGQAGITGFSSNPIPSTITIPGCSSGTGETWAQCLTTGVVPTSSFNTVAAALVSKYVPAANSGATGYSFNQTVTQTQNEYHGRVDYDFNPKNQITVVGLYQEITSLETLPFDGATLPGFGDGDISHTQQWTLDYVRQVSTSAVNDFALHYTRFNFKSGAPQQIVQPSSVGFDITPQDAVNSTVPTQTVAGYFTLGGTADGPQPRIDQTIQGNDSFSKIVGSHSLKFGYDGREFSVWNLFDASNSGNYGFSPTGAYSTGDPGLDYLLGVPATYEQGTGSIIQATAFLNYMYAQDTWKASKSLTIDYGLGYSIDTPLRNHQYNGEGVSCFIIGEQSTIFPNSPTNLVYPGDPGCHNSGQAVTHHNEFGPRIGFAWAPDLGRFSGSPGKFSIRGGFGMYYDRTEEESSLETLGTPPFGFTSDGAGDFGGVPQLINPFADINGGLTTSPTGGPGTASESNKFPFTQPTAGQPVSFAGFEPILEISSYAPSFRAPYAENFQLTVERELPSRMVLRVSYVGSLARRNQTDWEGNYETAAGHAACLANPTCIADQNLQAIDFPQNKVGGSPLIVEEGEVGSEGSSSYHSGQVSLEKGPTHGFQFQLSYTFAHALDNGSGFENSGFGGSNGRGYNQYDQSLNYGNSAYDARHHFVFAPVYISPLIHGKAFSPLSLALSGWQVSGIVTASTGLPYDISYGGGSSRSLYCDSSISFYACPDVPEQIAPLKRLNPRVRNASGFAPFFDPSSFAPEPIGSFGNISRDKYHGPGYNETNLVLAKNFILSASGVLRLQLRLESDNVFNHTNFGNPDGNINDGTFGQVTTITGLAPSRLTQLGGKFYF